MSESAEDAFIAELERREKEVNKFAKAAVATEVLEQQVETRVETASRKDRVPAELRKCERLLRNDGSLRDQLLQMKLALLVLAQDCGDEHSVWGRISALDEMISRTHASKPLKAHGNKPEKMPEESAEFFEEEMGEEGLGGFLEEEEEEEDPAVTEKLAQLKARAAVSSAVVSTRMQRLGLQDGAYDAQAESQFPTVPVLLAKKGNANADSLGARLEDLAAQKKKNKVQEFKDRAAKGDLDTQRPKQEKDKKSAPQHAEKKVFQAAEPKMPKAKAVDGMERPAAKALQKNQSALMQKKKKIAKLTYAKKFNMMQHKKRAYVREREPRLENYFGEATIKYQDKK